MNIAFFWTWDFSANILKSLVKDYFTKLNVVLGVSQADKPVWRRKILLETPLKAFCLEKSIEVIQPTTLFENKDVFEKLKNLNLDFIVVVSYWKIIPKEILSIAKSWCINIHGSILPNYRWASPIQEAIKNWDKKTGITIMYMNEKMDEWDILKIEEIEIESDDKTPDIFAKFENIAPKALVETLEKILKWEMKPLKQDDSKASYCSKIKKEDGRVIFKKQNWTEIYDKFRAYYKWPLIYSFFNWKKINFEEVILQDYLWKQEIWSVCKIDKKTIWIVVKWGKILVLKKVKLEWKNSLDILSFINWNKEFLNYIFE